MRYFFVADSPPFLNVTCYISLHFPLIRKHEGSNINLPNSHIQHGHHILDIFLWNHHHCRIYTASPSMILDVWFAVDIAAQWNHLPQMMEGISDRCTLLSSPRLKREYFHSGQNLRSNIPILLKTSFVWFKGLEL